VVREVARDLVLVVEDDDLGRGALAGFGCHSARMSNSGDGRPPELDQVRQMLYPNLPEEEGWARIEAALSGAADPKRWEAIERIASDPALGAAILERLGGGNLNDDLLLRLKELGEDPTEDSRPGDRG